MSPLGNWLKGSYNLYIISYNYMWIYNDLKIKILILEQS